MFQTIISTLLDIENVRILYASQDQARQVLFEKVITEPLFDEYMLAFLRHWTYLFLKKNSGASFNGFSITSLMESEEMTMEDYCKKLLKEKRMEVGPIISHLIPHCLKINVSIFSFNSIVESEIFEEEYLLEKAGFAHEFDPQDLIEMSGENIALLNYFGKYYLLYPHSDSSIKYKEKYVDFLKMVRNNMEEKIQINSMYAKPEEEIKLKCIHSTVSTKYYVTNLINYNKEQIRQGKFPIINCLFCPECKNFHTKEELKKYINEVNIEIIFNILNTEGQSVLEPSKNSLKEHFLPKEKQDMKRKKIKIRNLFPIKPSSQNKLLLSKIQMPKI